MANTVYVKNPQVTRIPVAGPAPYNTLVITQMQFSADLTDHWGETNNYFLYTVTVYTPFVLRGFDPSNPPPSFLPSTTVAFVDPGAAKNDHFLFAVDEITDSGFDPEGGQFYVTFNTAVQLPDNSIPQVQVYDVGFYAGYLISAMFALTSYVLVNEPHEADDAPTPQDGPSGFQRYRGSLPPGILKYMRRELREGAPGASWLSRLPPHRRKRSDPS